ncbi:MAG: BamA/TamA family outer membrane protein [Hydrococcus sp. Prado102]|nr:BamA/TamA family outer membrane protein [Hydrococcus sp. Prado102]
MKLSPLILLCFTATAVLNLSNAARGETADPTLSGTEAAILEETSDALSKQESQPQTVWTREFANSVLPETQQDIEFELDERSHLETSIAPLISQTPDSESEEETEPDEEDLQAQETPETEQDSESEEETEPDEEDLQAQETPETEEDSESEEDSETQETPEASEEDSDTQETPESEETPTSPTQEAPSPQTPPTQTPEAPGEAPVPPIPTPTPDTPAPQVPVPQPPTTPTPESPESPVPPPPGASEEPAEESRVLVAEVLVDGADRELTDLVYNTIRTRPGRTATRSQLQEDINAIYATGFFANVRVTPEDTPLGVRVIFAVAPNPILQRIQIRTVPETEQPRVLPDKVVEETFKEQYGRILNLRDLQEGIRQLNEWYSQNGYDLAQVVESPQVAEDGTVTLIIAEGVIENIDVRYFDEEDEPTEGKTRPFIVTREMELKPGDVFNRNTAQRDLQRVFGLGIFEDARLSFSPGQDPRRVVVNVDIVEGNTGSLAAGAGFSSNSGFFGTASYQEQNLGGNNQTLGAEIQIGSREQLFDVSFTDPWIGGDPYRTSYTLNIFRRQSISLVFDGDDTRLTTDNGDDSPRVVRTGGGITFSRPLAENPYTRPDWRLSTGFSYQRVQLENADGETAPKSSEDDGFQNLAFDPSGEDDLFLLSFGATQDFRNSSTQPTSGSLLRLGVEQSIPIGSGNIFLSRLRASYSYYIPVDFIDLGFTEEELPQAFAFNVQGGTVLGDLPPYEAFVLGGSNSVRGYGEGELGSGRTYVQATAEYRFPILSFLGAALFVDYGTTLGSGDGVPGNPSGVRELPGSGFGYGLGVRVNSPVGPIRIDYGWNDEGDSRIHFGIGERF